MSLYSNQTEEHIYAFRKGLLSQPPPVKQTHLWLRLVLMAFTLLCMIAVVGFVIFAFDLKGRIPSSLTFLIFAVLFYWIGERIIVRNRLYRYGIEEALTLGGAAFFWGALVGFADMFFSANRWEEGVPALAACLVFTWIHRRLGHFLAALAALVALAVAFFSILNSEVWARWANGAFLVILFYVNSERLSRSSWKFERARHLGFEAVLLGAAYLLLNLRMFSLLHLGIYSNSTQPTAGFPAWFYWATYALVFALPVAALFFGLKKHHRPVIDVSLVCFLMSLLTNKMYLNKPRYDWDPMILGLFLIGLALVVQRLLSKDPIRAKTGLTAEKRTEIDTSGLDLASLGPAFAPSNAPVSGETNPFSGGQSGGGGASGSY